MPFASAVLWQSARNIYAVGRNYAAHIDELGSARPQEPVVFAKSVSSLTISRRLAFPRQLAPVDHEVELALRLGADVPLGAFAGLGCVSHIGLGVDFTARALQKKLKAGGLPWHRSKSFRHACFLGPLREGVDLDSPIHFELQLNGQTRQLGDTGQMLFGFAAILGFINQTAALREGDLVYTGTPSGVGPVAHGDAIRLISAELKTDLALEVSYAQP